MKFKEWFLKEVGSFTNSVAVFSLPLGSGMMGSKLWPQLLNDDDEEKPKHKKRKKHKKKEEE